MNGKAVGAIIIVGLVTFSSATPVLSAAEGLGTSLRIYLPRKIITQEDYLRLSQVAIIRGDEALATKAGNIPLGRISVPGQKVVLERSTILSRLACNGISAQKVTFTGAKRIVVEQQRQVIEGTKFVELAKCFLKAHAPTNLVPSPSAVLRVNSVEGSVCQWEPMWIPKDMILTGQNEDIKFAPQLIETGTKNQAKVRITVLVADPVGNDKELGMSEVTLRARYNCHRAVTLAQIAVGDVITAENVKIEEDICGYPEPANWCPPYGLVARRPLPANTVISPDMLDLPKAAVRIGRNETVVIRVQMPGLVVTAMGKTMQNGRTGEHIKVRNLDSQRIILCRVNEDGTVQPVL